METHAKPQRPYSGPISDHGWVGRQADKPASITSLIGQVGGLDGRMVKYIVTLRNHTMLVNLVVS